MTGRVLTQPELCELPPSVLLLLPLSPSRDPRPHPLVPSVFVPFLTTCVPLLLSSKRSPSVPPILSGSRVTHTRQIRTVMFFPLFFRRPKGENKGISRVRATIERGERESRYTFKVYIHTRYSLGG